MKARERHFRENDRMLADTTVCSVMGDWKKCKELYILGKCIREKSVDEPEGVESDNTTVLLCRAKCSRLYVWRRSDSHVHVLEIPVWWLCGG